MSIWLRMIGFLSILAIIFAGQSIFAGEQETMPENTGEACGRDTRFFQRELIVWGVVAEGASRREFAAAPEIRANNSSLNAHEVLLWDYGPIDDRSNGGNKNRFVNLNSLITNEVEDLDSVESVEPSIVFGVNYAFKRFRLNHFYHSILYFISDDADPGRENAVAFYVDIP